MMARGQEQSSAFSLRLNFPRGYLLVVLSLRGKFFFLRQRVRDVEVKPAFNDFAVDDSIGAGSFDSVGLGNLLRIGRDAPGRPNGCTALSRDVGDDFIAFDCLIIDMKLHAWVAA